MRKLSHTWDRITLYLPVILMGVLALGTYMLTRSQQRPPDVKPPVAVQRTHDADYVMQGFALRGFAPNGQLQTELRGQSLHHYPDTDTLEATALWLLNIDEHGRRTEAQGARGFSSGDGSDITLTGQAHMIRPAATVNGRLEPRLEVHSEFLHLQPNAKRLNTDQPVRVLRGQDTLTAGRLALDGEARTLQLGGRVRAVIQPKATAR